MARSSSTSLAKEPPGLEGIQLDSEEGIVTLRLSRLDTLNAFDARLVSELTAAVEWCAAIEDLKCLVVTGTGKGFSAGGHLPTLQRGAADPSELEATVGYLAEELNKTIQVLDDMSCPVLAAVNGRAAGAGLSLALACDMRIASERAVFDFAYARVGATPDGGMTWFLPRIVGRSRAIELLMQSPILRPKHALELGLVSAVVPPDELAPHIRTLTRRLARQPRHYIGKVRELVQNGANADLAVHLETERTELLASLRTDEARVRLSELGRDGSSP